jgi:hypothetical protein
MVSSIVYSFYAAFRRDLNFSLYIEYEVSEFFTLNKNHQFSEADLNKMNKFWLVMELIFLFEILLSSITSYTDKYEKKVTDLSKIRKNYFENGFMWDLIAIFPFTSLFHWDYMNLLFLIKCIRLYEAFDILDVKNFNRELKRIYKKEHDIVCDSEMKDDKIIDHNFVVQ